MKVKVYAARKIRLSGDAAFYSSRVRHFIGSIERLEFMGEVEVRGELEEKLKRGELRASIEEARKLGVKVSEDFEYVLLKV